MSKKSSKKKKTQQPVIPKELKVNLTTSMRSELGEETFENATAVQPVASDVLVPSESSTQKSERVQAVILCPDRDRTIQYQNDLLSVYEGTAGTISFESLISVGEKTDREAGMVCQEENKLQQLKRIPIRKPNWKKEETVEEKEFIEGKQLPGMVEELTCKRGEPEMDYIQSLVEDINQLVAGSGRTDVLLEHSIQFETNHLPLLRVRLGKKSKEEKKKLEELEMVERLLENKTNAKTAEAFYFGDVLEAVNDVFEKIL